MADSPGHPKKFDSAEEIQQKTEEYFDKCAEEETPPTVTGLAMHLDTTRRTLLDYESGEYDTEEKKYSHAIKKAKDKVQKRLEEELYRNGSVTGIIFNLKNNFGWADKQETDITSDGEQIKGNTIQLVEFDDDESESEG